MPSRQCNMAALYLIITLLLTCVTPTLSKQQQLSPAEMQAALLLHNLMKANPNINNLIKLAESLPDDNNSTGPLQGVTLNPLLSMALGALQSIQSPFTGPSNATTNNGTNFGNGTLGPAPNVTSPDMMSLVQLMMQNPAYRDVMMEVFGEVQSGLTQARNDGVDVTSNFTALLSYVNPLSVLRKAALPLLSASQFPDQTDLVNPECYRDVVDTLTSLLGGEGWAIEMLDAMGKPNAGIERGSFYFVGSYDQCVNIKPHVVRRGPIVNTERDFGTRHCRVDISIPKALTDALNLDTHGIHLKLIWGACVPSTCHEHDVRGLFKLGFLNQTNIPIEDVKCHRDLDLGSDESAIAAIIIFSFFGFLVFTGTLIDGCRACSGNGEVESKAKTNAQSRECVQPVKTESTKGIAVIDKKDGMPNGNSTTSQTVVTADDVTLELPPGYVPHKEGPHLPLYVSKPPPEPATSGPGASNGTAGNAGKRETSRASTSARRDSAFVRALLCFSVYTNIPKILGAKSAPGSISCVHGIRLLSIMWVILGHTYNYGLISNQGTFTADNLVDFEPVYQRFTYQAVMAGGYAVDTFFLLSGFLLTWIQLKEADKRKQKLDVRTGVMYYFHRFWRLTPIYMFVLMGYTCLWRYLGSGPFWPNYIEAAEVCRDSWWTNLLYVNNLVKTDEQCMGWSWYLANDMQFYVISPIFIIAMYFSPTLGVILTSALLAMGVGISFWKEDIYNGGFMTMLSDGGDYWRNVYTVPWCRVSCWAVGMLLGLVIYKRGQKALRNKKLYGVGWLLAWGVALFLVYITYTKHKKDGIPWTPVQSAFHESFGRAAWAACVAWVIFACYTGKGGVVNSLLSWNGLIPLSRLSYAAYLVHPICMQVYVFSRRALFHVDDYNTIYLFLGHSCVTFMVAFVFSLVFEAPFMALEKVLLPQPRRK